MAHAAAAERERTLVGAVLSRRWRLLRKLGAGGMGEVYAAAPVEEGGARVAIKLLRSEFVHEPQVLTRFVEEARTCARLVHPNIVRVTECASAEDGTPYMVMELLDGVPLGAYTQDGGRIPVAQAVPILQGILAGLGAAHAAGIVHRDLKPDNVFLTRDPGGSGTFVVKVLDFGIAKVMDVAGGMGSCTRTGMLLGTPAYMSPEQIRSAKDVDARADLWSVGVMFYEMLTGRVAFPAPTEFARLAAVLGTEPEPMDRIDPSLAPLAPLVALALRKDREQRFQSAADMASALVAAAPGAALAGAAIGVPLGPPPAIAPAPGVGGTLASPAHGMFIEAPPHVELLPPRSSLGETLQSKAAAARIVRGVAPWIVVVLVAVALAAGLLFGWTLARTS